MNRLIEVGFSVAGHWLLKESNIHFELIRYSTQKNFLYAFACDGQVKYVGKTTRQLSQRMSNYKNPDKTQATNVKGHDRILQFLTEGTAVDILALPDNGLVHYGQFHLNLAAALEDSIIKIMKPEWNGGTPETVQSISTKPTLPQAGYPSHQFNVKLHPTYYGNGFFNIGVDNEEHIGADGETIELFIGKQEQPILGTINRCANANGTPRIMGGSGLRNWFNENFDQLGTVLVEVISPMSLRLSKSSKTHASNS